MKLGTGGCAICGSTWGNFWGDVDGERMFFCCEVCYFQFRNMIQEVKKRTGWTKIDELDIEGDYTGRRCDATGVDGNDRRSNFRFFVTFNSKGEIQRFKNLMT
jgi:hypothetical protein